MKTFEEYVEQEGLNLELSGREIKLMHMVWDEAVLASAPKWIPVSERLPAKLEKSYHVAALCKKKYGFGPYDGEPQCGVYQYWAIRTWPQNYTHWMPLPDPPKG